MEPTVIEGWIIQCRTNQEDFGPVVTSPHSQHG